MSAEFLSESSVAEFFDTSKSTVKRWVERGVLPPPSVIGGLKRWPVDELRAAARRGLDAASGAPARSADPDEVMERILRDGPRNKDRKAQTRRRNG